MIQDRELQDTWEYEHGVKRPIPRPTASDVDRARKVIGERCTGMDAITAHAIFREIAWLEAENARLRSCNGGSQRT